jgi:hypothetical protein
VIYKVTAMRGATLIDLIFTCGLIAVIAVVAIPSLHASRERDAALMAARHLASKLTVLRIEAIRRNRSVAMRFDPDELGRFGTYVDGDGDGVLQQDIDRGIDRSLEAEAHLAHYFATVSYRVALSVPMPDGSGVIAAGADPLRIGGSNLLSFSPVGSATSGTIYLAGRAGTQVCVRVFGATGRVRVLRFDRVSDAWRPD